MINPKFSHGILSSISFRVASRVVPILRLLWFGYTRVWNALFPYKTYDCTCWQLLTLVNPLYVFPIYVYLHTQRRSKTMPFMHQKNTINISYDNIAITGHSLNSVNVVKNTSMDSLGLVCSIHNGIIPVANMWDDLSGFMHEITATAANYSIWLLSIPKEATAK